MENIYKTTAKRKKRKYYSNLYLYTQIVSTAIFVTVAILLKVNNVNGYEQLKEDYTEFFTTDITEYSNFSYKTYIDNLSNEIKEKYEELTTVISYINGKGSNDTYPQNISMQKYIPDEKGIMPVKGIVTSNFGSRKDPFNKKKSDFHTGMDIAAEKGTFIKAAFDGIVVETGYTDIAGNYIRIKTDDDFTTFYGHTQFILVKENDKILQGQVIATVGDSGRVTGPHLHFETVYQGNRVDPQYTVD